MLCVVGCLLIAIVVCCLFSVVCWLSYDACRWWLRGVFLPFVCLLRDVPLSLVIIVCWGVACCVMDVRCVLSVVCCLLCCVCYVLFAVCSSLCVVCCQLFVGCRSSLCCCVV